VTAHSKSRFTAVDAFCGAGGLSLGLVRAGFNVCYAFDNNPSFVETYRRNLGSHVHVASAEAVSAESIGLAAPISLVAGGPPCQGFSVQRRGDRNDARNDLVFEFLRIVKELQPTLFLMENVAALKSPSNSSYFDRLVAGAKAVGYEVEAKILNAADFGVPQVRKRLFLLGTKCGATIRPTLPTGTVAKEQWRTVREAIGDLPPPGTLHGQFFPNHLPDNISALNRERISHVPPGGGRSDIPVHLRLPCHAVSVETAGHRGVYGRLPWDKPAGTITTKCNSFTRGRFAHPSEDRNISMREAARLQSFPDDFVFEGNKVDVAHQIGNAVPPTLAFAIARHLMDQLRAIDEHSIETCAPVGTVPNRQRTSRAT
jgi:DNA (cytosine-5)-methyltransferase 1